MGTIVDAGLPADQFALEAAVAEDPTVEELSERLRRGHETLVRNTL